MSSQLTVQRAEHFDRVPSDHSLEQWATAVTEQFEATGEVTLRIVNEAEMRRLNREFRQQDKVTNVLAFEVDEETRKLHGLLGDIAICAPLVVREATEQGKEIEAHWAHLLIHGALHLLGFDHITDDQAEEMEAHEVQLLAKWGYDNPYYLDSTLTQGIQNV